MTTSWEEGRWEHSRRPRHGLEQRGYDLIGAMVRKQRLRASLTQRELETMTKIDQTVISRLENGKQYGLRWSRFATLIGVLDRFDPDTVVAKTPWWAKLGITPPDYMLPTLRQQGLLPPLPPEIEPQQEVDGEFDPPAA